MCAGVGLWIGSTLLFVPVVVRLWVSIVSVGERGSIDRGKVEVVGCGIGRLYWVSRTKWGEDRSDAVPLGCDRVQRQFPPSDRTKEHAGLRPLGPESQLAMILRDMRDDSPSLRLGHEIRPRGSWNS
jgi:hypothetical protein